jgi:hypothetical protein
MFDIMMDPVALVSNLLKMHGAPVSKSFLQTIEDVKQNASESHGTIILDSVGRGVVHLEKCEEEATFRVESVIIHPTYRNTTLLQKIVLATPVTWTIRVSSQLHLPSNMFWKSLKGKEYFDENDEHYFEVSGRSNDVPLAACILVEL